MKNAKRVWMQRIQIKGLLIGLVAAILVMFVLAAIGASLINSGALQEENMRILSLLTVLIASLIGSVVASIGNANGNLLQICAFSIAYALIMTVVNISFFEGRFTRVLLWLLAVAVGAVVAALIKARKKQGRGIKKIRIP